MSGNLQIAGDLITARNNNGIITIILNSFPTFRKCYTEITAMKFFPTYVKNVIH